MPDVTEWTFTADATKWMEQILQQRPDLPFSRAEVEERGRASQKRRDITLYDRNNRPVITGEVKMPDKPDGRSPFQEALVMDAHAKADSIGAEYYFTWNVNRCVLWRTFEQGKPITERQIEHFELFPSPIRHADEVEIPRIQEQIKQFLASFLDRCAAILSGVHPMLIMPLDEKFLNIWEAALEQPVAQTLYALSTLYEKDRAFTADLDRWMREEQGWTISHRDEEIVRDNLERAAKFSCYVLANKLIFYKALRRRFSRMRALKIADSVTTGAELRLALEDYFAHAIEFTRDYETIFKSAFGDTLPLRNDAVVDSWRDLSQQTDGFDFTQIDYEIVGQIFERLLSTEERHKFGQHYTRSEVVDLINAFCIREASATVFDPACGGGTFLVRAYNRKRDLSGGSLTHALLIRQLYGTDISAYPVHLTTLNLATRDLVDQANYPLVARKDFFAVRVGDPLFLLPFGGRGGQAVTEQIGKVDVIVGNPPYVRQTRINEYYGSAYKKMLRELAEKESPTVELSGQSDIHCYFFPHALRFLREGGYIGFLVSSSWLDTGYGFRLQKFLLDHFEIVALFESSCEPWFTGARVTTVAIILHHQPDPERRAANQVKFVLLDQPLSDLLTYVRTEEDRRLTFEQLRDRIETMTGTEELLINPGDSGTVRIRQESMEGFRVRIVNQGDLTRLGMLPFTVGEEEEEEDEEEQAAEAVKAANGDWHKEMKPEGASADSEYIGYKWGIFLRAPDIFFKLLRRGGTAFAPLGQIAPLIKRGVTSGCDDFFFPRDKTEEALQETPDRQEFKQKYGIYPSDTRRIRIVLAGDGSVHRIEREYLEPVAFNLMEIDAVEIDPARLKKRILLVSEPKSGLKGKQVLKYIQWGEEEGFHRRSTCASRQLWYQLPVTERSNAFWTMAHRYRHIVPLNTARYICNHNLFDLFASADVPIEPLVAVLNSTIVAMLKHQFGRKMGGDPVLKTEVVDVKMMLVPDPRRATESVRRRLEEALASLRKRQIGHLVAVDSRDMGPTGELAMEDRHALDDAVLELLGITDAQERQSLRAELYAEMTTLYRSIRTAEKRMQKFRSQAARRGRATAHSLAGEIWDDFTEEPLFKTLLDFAPPAEGETIELPAGRAQAVNDLLNPASLFIAGRYIALEHPDRVRYAKTLADDGIQGRVTIPRDVEACRAALHAYHDYVEQTNAEFERLAAAYTADEAMQKRVVRELWRKTRQAGED